jgi:hypothetical protein
MSSSKANTFKPNVATANKGRILLFLFSVLSICMIKRQERRGAGEQHFGYAQDKLSDRGAEEQGSGVESFIHNFNCATCRRNSLFDYL